TGYFYDFFTTENYALLYKYTCYIMTITDIIKGVDQPLIIRLDFESKTPIYIQLVQRIMEGIAKKELTIGERLPSVRSLAADIGINLHTVNKAYKELEQKGFIQIHRQKGVVINPEGIPKADDLFKEELVEILKPLITEAICRDVSREAFLKQCEALYASYGK